MGNTCAGPPPPVSVKLRVYDFTTKGLVANLNSLLSPVGTGAYHIGVQIFDQEWSYRKTDDGGTGIYCCPPCGDENHAYRELLRVGKVEMTREDVEDVLVQMRGEWMGRDFDLLHRNSCHFSNALCAQLGVDPVPEHLMKLASTGAKVCENFRQATGNAQGAAALAAARVGEIDGRLRDGARAGREQLAARTRELDSRLGITERATQLGVAQAASGVAERAGHAAARAERLKAQLAEQARGVLAEGKDSRGAAPDDGYRFGDFTRGLLQKLPAQGARAEQGGQQALPEGAAAEGNRGQVILGGLGPPRE